MWYVPNAKPKYDLCSNGLNVLRHVVEEKLYGYIQYARELKQPGSANAVGSTLVFLNLLESQPYSVAELLLA